MLRRPGGGRSLLLTGGSEGGLELSAGEGRGTFAQGATRRGPWLEKRCSRKKAPPGGEVPSEDVTDGGEGPCRRAGRRGTSELVRWKGEGPSGDRWVMGGGSHHHAIRG